MADGDEDAGWGFVVAHHDFPAQEKGDLKLTQGDVVRVLQATNDEWLEGVLGDNQGIFPLNFVNRTDPPNNGRAEATESHTAAAASSDLSFRAGDTIDLLQRPSATHYRGRLHSKEGLVPTSKIRVTTALVPYAIASFDFDEGQAGDLELRIGDNIVLLKQVNDEWLQGYSRRTHKKGMFPAAFVDVKVTLDEASVMHVKTAPPPARKASLGKHPAPSKPPPPATTPPARSLPPPRKSPKATQRRQSSTKTSPSSSRPKGAAVALYDYTSTEQGDLQFHAHDEIVLLKQVNPEWYEGFVRTQPAVKGIFPANFVHVTKEIPPSPAPSPQQARAPAPAAKAKPPPPKPQPQPQPRQSAAPPAKPYAPPPKRASATPSSTSAQAPTATASTTTATPAPKPKPIPKPKAKPKPTPKPPPPAPAAKTAAPPPATAVTTARTTTTTTTAPAAPAAPAMSAAATAEQERRKPSPRPPPSSNHPRHGSPDLKPMRAAPTPTRNAPRPPQATAAPAKKAVPSVCRPPGAVPLRRAPSTRPAAETVQQRRLSMGKPEKPQTKPRQTHTQAPAKPAPRPRPQPKPRAERPVRPRSRVLSMSIQDQSAKQLSSVHEEPEETLEEQIARLEALHDEALDREIGFETLLSVMTDLDDDQRQEKEEQLEAARREVADLEEQLNTLYAQRGDVNEEESDMSLSESQILPNGRDLGSVKQAISELNARIEELEQELADEKKQAKAAQKLADLASLDTATAKMDVSQVQAEAQRHQQLIQTKELFISSLQAEREGLIAQIPEHLRQRDSMLVREVEMLEQVAATEAEQHELQEKKAKKRANVSKELVETEEEYLDNLLLCKQAYLDPATGLPSKTGFDVAILFGNLEEVIDVVQAFCLRLKREHEKPVEQQEFGRAFCDHAAAIKRAYVKYCTNFGDALSLLSEYASDPHKRERLQECQASISHLTSTWDLNSFLIKPVQRIPKYPMLLSDLIKTTSAEHRDHDLLKVAVQRITEIASAINESKRRKELVDRYKQEKVKHSAVRLDRMNWHSTRKKAVRLNQKLFHSSDSKKSRAEYREFHAQEARVRIVEQAAKKVQKIAEEYIEGIRGVYEKQDVLARRIQDLYSEQASSVPDHVRLFVSTVEDMQSCAFDFEKSVRIRVREPMDRLLLMFKQPYFLIDKRKHKKLDYDSYRRQHSKAKDPEKQKALAKDLELAQRNFQALDSELTTQLPTLAETGKRIVTRAVVGLLDLEYRFTKTALEKMSAIEFQQADDEVVRECAALQRKAMMDMLGLRILPRTVAKEFELPTDISFLQKSSRRKLRESVGQRPSFSRSDRASLYDESETNAPPPLISRASVVSAPSAPAPTDPVAYARATFDFEAVEDEELTVHQGEEVAVLAMEDVGGNPEWWLCRSGDGHEGYVGAEFLTLMDGDHHGRMTHDTGDLTPQDTVPEAIGMAVVVWTFEAESEIEVSCDENEEVEVLSYEDPDGNSEWVLIRRSTGEEGYVAANFLQFDS